MVRTLNESRLKRLRRYLTRDRLKRRDLDTCRIDKIYKPLIAKAKGQEQVHLRDEYRVEKQTIEEAYWKSLTEGLRKQAAHLDIELPPEPKLSQADMENEEFQWGNENWEVGISGFAYLTSQGRIQARKEIHEELKRRQERQDRHLPWIMALITLIGTIMGAVGLFATIYTTIYK